MHPSLPRWRAFLFDVPLASSPSLRVKSGWRSRKDCNRNCPWPSSPKGALPARFSIRASLRKKRCQPVRECRRMLGRSPKTHLLASPASQGGRHAKWRRRWRRRDFPRSRRKGRWSRGSSRIAILVNVPEIVYGFDEFDFDVTLHAGQVAPADDTADHVTSLRIRKDNR